MLGYRLKKLRDDCLIDAYATNADTQPRAHMPIVAAALVAMGVARAHAVEHSHHPATSPTAHQTGQQRPATSGGLAGHALLHMRVLSNHLLVFLELFPTDIAGVMVAQKDVPV